MEGGETPHAVERMVRIRIQGGKAQLLHLCPEQEDGQDAQGQEPEEAQLLQSRHRPQDPERAHARAAGQHPVQRGAAGRGNPVGQALCGGAKQRGRHPRVRQADGKTARTPLYRAFAGAGCENRGHHRERDGGDIEGVTPVKESRFAYVLHDDGDLLGGQQPLPGDIPRLFQRFRQPVGAHP